MSTPSIRRSRCDAGRIPWLALVLLPFVVFGVGCGTPLTTEELAPSHLITTFYKDTYCHHYWCGDLCVHGTQPDIPAGGTVIAGFSHFYDPGTDPFPCTEKVDIVYGAAVRFDLSTFDSITSATLHFKWDQTYMTGPGTTADSALTQIGVATDDWPSMVHPGDVEIGYLPIHGEDLFDVSHADHDFAIDVSNIARSWVNHDRNNYGLVLFGPNNGYPEDNDVWQSRYRNFSLTVIYNPAQNPRHH
jgi:hypothetical protein